MGRLLVERLRERYRRHRGASVHLIENRDRTDRYVAGGVRSLSLRVDSGLDCGCEQSRGRDRGEVMASGRNGSGRQSMCPGYAHQAETSQRSSAVAPWHWTQSPARWDSMQYQVRMPEIIGVTGPNPVGIFPVALKIVVLNRSGKVKSDLAGSNMPEGSGTVLEAGFVDSIRFQLQ